MKIKHFQDYKGKGRQLGMNHKQVQKYGKDVEAKAK